MRELTENTLHILIHELKNPITIIRGYSDLLPDSDEKEIEEYSKIIARETDYVSFLINNISTLNKLEENIPIVICKESVDIKDIIESLVYIYEKKNKNITWQREYEFSKVQTDLSLIKIILFNIIENAFKYTEKGAVSIKTYNNKISVKDTGCGIEKDKLQNITDLYFRANDQIPGTGIGLFIVNTVCQKININLEIKSEKNIGTEIILSF